MPAGATTLSIAQGSFSATYPISVVNDLPGIFTLDSSGKGAAAVVNLNGSINGVNNPEPMGSIISVYATGIGPLCSST